MRVAGMQLVASSVPATLRSARTGKSPNARSPAPVWADVGLNHERHMGVRVCPLTGRFSACSAASGVAGPGIDKRRSASPVEQPDSAEIVNGAALVGPTAEYERMMSFQESDEAVNVAESRRKRDHDRIACFLHLRDLVYRHPEAASASAVSVVRTLEAQVIAAKAAREKGRAEARAKEVRQRYGFG